MYVNSQFAPPPNERIHDLYEVRIFSESIILMMNSVSKFRTCLLLITLSVKPGVDAFLER